MEYRVKWFIDLEADSPEHAARQAIEIQQDPDSTATCFNIFWGHGFNKEIDLLDSPDNG